ncbi:glycoside hydrolase family 16 protein [Robertkochia aurantiaca]|uniref:glycoside hydrolase family 16 protein n=1 Tax=Robertkochia aurantiaca TaxID=2873700 RepID=UPI001CCEB7DB|nr:glycoside hydrolase family 16 protein [Robertkochia sp. 3YJGBD-33]
MKKIALVVCFLAGLVSLQAQKLVLFEDFEGSSLDSTLWNIEKGNGCPDLCGWGNNELQLYGDESIGFEDGNLVITARKEGDAYHSARINTKDKFEFRYGTVEIRANIPEGKGLWPAFWMLGSNIDEVGWPVCGEIDILEYVGREPGMVFTSMHTASSHGNTINTQKTYIDNIEKGFHLFRADWTPESITFSVDGEKVYTYAPKEKNEETWPYDQPFYLLLNMAIGGNFGGPEVNDAIFPARYVIDYIKVYQAEDITSKTRR